MSLGGVFIEGAEFCDSLITARLATEFGCEAFGVPGNVTRAVNYAPNLLIQARRKTGRQRRRRHRRTVHGCPGRSPAGRKTRSRAAKFARRPSRGASEKRLYDLLHAEETGHIEDRVENSGLNSSEVLATLFDLEMKNLVRQSRGKQFSKIMLQLALSIKSCFALRHMRRLKSTRKPNLRILIR